MRPTTIIMAFLLAITATAALQDTQIDYMQYRESAPTNQGLVYQIKITNTGNDTRQYSILPDTNAIRNIGSYLVHPSDYLELEPDQEITVVLYIEVQNQINERIQIPITIESDDESTTINLVARPGTDEPVRSTGAGLRGLLSLLMVILLAYIIISLLRKKPKIETY